MCLLCPVIIFSCKWPLSQIYMGMSIAIAVSELVRSLMTCHLTCKTPHHLMDVSTERASWPRRNSISECRGSARGLGIRPLIIVMCAASLPY